MKTPKLTPQEKKIEKELIEGVYKHVSTKQFKTLSEAIQRRKKDSVLNIRINSRDLENIKQKAKKLGVRYQTFISEVLHEVALK